MLNSAFKTRTVKDYAQSLANYLPSGPLFAAKNKTESNLRSLIQGLAFTLFDVNGYIKEFTDDISPVATRKFLEEWENALGLPDECLNEPIDDLSNNERRRNIIAKLSYMTCQTGTDIEELASWFGYDVTVYAGNDPTTPHDAVTGLTTHEKRFTIVVQYNSGAIPAVFTYTFPMPFGEGIDKLVKCVIRKVIPSNCNLVFYVP